MLCECVCARRSRFVETVYCTDRISNRIDQDCMKAESVYGTQRCPIDHLYRKQRRIYGFWCPGQDFQTVPPPPDGPLDDGFQLTLSVSKFTYLLHAFCSPLFGAPLPWCPGQLPQSPTPRSTTVSVLSYVVD